METPPEALEGLGLAAWWLDDAAVTFDARERAYRLYRQDGDPKGAARMAIYLAYDYFSFRGEYAVASGWNQRAHRLLEGLEPTPEQGLLAVYEGYMELMRHNDTAMARSLGSQAAELGRTLGMIDLEMLALALEGLARVSEGDITGGYRRLDDAIQQRLGTSGVQDIFALGVADELHRLLTDAGFQQMEKGLFVSLFSLLCKSPTTRLAPVA